MLEVRPTALDGVVELVPARHGDARGFLSETWSAAAFASAGLPAIDWVQDNHSRSAAAGTLRGLHFQAPPAAQAKLVRVTRGGVFDVVVDIRRGSPTYGRWVGATLSAEAWNQLLIPQGFAHGFLTLEPDCEVQYKVSAGYSPKHDRAIRYDDPEIAIAWPEVGPLTLSDKDRAAPLLAHCESGFAWP